MAERSYLLTAEHELLGTLYACVDPSARFTAGKVGPIKMAALLAPYQTESEAAAALLEAGAKLPAGGAA